MRRARGNSMVMKAFDLHIIFCQRTTILHFFVRRAHPGWHVARKERGKEVGIQGEKHGAGSAQLKYRQHTLSIDDDHGNEKYRCSYDVLAAHVSPRGSSASWLVLQCAITRLWQNTLYLALYESSPRNISSSIHRVLRKMIAQLQRYLTREIK